MHINRMALSVASLPFIFSGTSWADSGVKTLYATKETVRVVFIGDAERIGVLVNTFKEHGFEQVGEVKSRPDCIVLAKALPSGESTQYGMYCYGGKETYQGGTFAFSNNHGRVQEALAMLPPALDILYRSAVCREYPIADFIRLPWMSAICLKNGCIPLYQNKNDS